MQDVEPEKSRGEQTPGMTSRTRSANSQSESGFSCTEIRNESACCRIARIPLLEQLLNTFVIDYDDFFFLLDFVAVHLYTPFSQFNSDSKPVKTARRGWSNHYSRTSGSDFLTNQRFGLESDYVNVVSLSELCFPTRCRSSRSLKICLRQHDA